MSVTFAPEFRRTDVVGYVMSCCPDCRSEEFGTYQEAESARAALPGIDTYSAALPGCPNVEWSGGGTVLIVPVLAEEGPSVNMSNANARFVLDRLGLLDESGELCGSASPADLRGRILVATALAGGDPGVPAVEYQGSQWRMVNDPHDEAMRGDLASGTIVDCGRAPGYLDKRLVSLTELVDWCEQRGRSVDWA